MDGGLYNPRTVEEVFRDFKGRRTGLIKALTTGVLKFFIFALQFLFLSHFYLARIFSLWSNVGIFTCYFCGADVEEFYQQCDPG